MKTIYIVNVRMTGCNGNIINCINKAYFDENRAIDAANLMWIYRPKNDPNYLTKIEL